MANIIKIKSSTVSGTYPSGGQLEVGELGLNLPDKKLFSKDVSGLVFEVSNSVLASSGRLTLNQFSPLNASSPAVFNLSSIVYTQSSQYSPLGYPGLGPASSANMTDSTNATGAGTVYEVNPWIKMDLGSVNLVSSVIVGAFVGWGTVYTQNAILEYSVDGVVWVSAGSTGVFATVTELKTFVLNVSARYLRISYPALLRYLSVGTFLPVVSNSVTEVGSSSLLHFVPWNGNSISLFYQNSWRTMVFSTMSVMLPNLFNNTNFDVFIYMLSPTSLTLEFVAWSSDIVRQVDLVLVSGVLVKSGSTEKRYLGTVRVSLNSFFEDNNTKRFVWNMNNRVAKCLYISNSAAHFYTGGSLWRPWNNDASFRLGVVLGQPQGLEFHLGCAATGTTQDVGAAFDGAIPGYDSFNVSGTGVSQSRGGRSYTSRGPVSGYHYCQVYEYPLSGTQFINATLEGIVEC